MELKRGVLYLIIAVILSVQIGGCGSSSSNSASSVDDDPIVTDPPPPPPPPEEECVICHGMPPISPCDEPSEWARIENYPGGGGAHSKHIHFIRRKIEEAGMTPTIEDLCSPCHGELPGKSEFHNSSNVYNGFFWDTLQQSEVDIVDGRGNFGQTSIYNGTSVLEGEGAKGGEPQRCSSFNCHGASAPSNPPMELLWDFACEEYGDDLNAETAYNEMSGDILCAGCHGHDPGKPSLRTRIIITGGEEIVYDSDDPRPLPHGVAASYFRGLSGFSLGGHGDPLFKEFYTGDYDYAPDWDLPISCMDCHDKSAAHYPASSSNIHRLVNQVVESDQSSEPGLCDSCHSGHVGHYGYKDGIPVLVSNKALIPVDSTTTTTTVVIGESSFYEQSAYGTANTSGDVDYYVNWNWATDAPLSTPDRLVVLPSAKYLMVGEVEERMTCTTCHNPHGVDLPSESGRMLRLKFYGNDLCIACHSK